MSGRGGATWSVWQSREEDGQVDRWAGGEVASAFHFNCGIRGDQVFGSQPELEIGFWLLIGVQRVGGGSVGGGY